MIGVSVPSGVAAQPMGNDETRRGAHNRAANALATEPEAAYGIGIEGGCTFESSGALQVFAWVAIHAADGTRGESRTAAFYLPSEVAQWLAQGVELGEADDRVFSRENSKQANGSVGLLTDDRITRTSYYTPAVVLALIPFMNPGLSFP